MFVGLLAVCSLIFRCSVDVRWMFYLRLWLVGLYLCVRGYLEARSIFVACSIFSGCLLGCVRVFVEC